MTELIITRGLPGSGKSTWANAYANNGWGIVVERDMLRKELTGKFYTGDQEVEHKVTKLQIKRVKGLLELGYTAIVSDTNLPDRSVKQWHDVAHSAGVNFSVMDFRDVPLEKVLGRNGQRGRELEGKKVPEEVIRDKWERFIKGRDLSKPVEWSPKAEEVIEPYVQPGLDIDTNNALIFDIDGTLAIMGDRSPYDGAKVWLDTLNVDVCSVLRRHYAAGIKIIIVTGRDEIYRDVTEKWLLDNAVYHDELYMRPTEEGQKREDSIIKYELFNQHIRPQGMQILGVFDDRHRVLRMWRKLGLTTFHVNGPDAGNF